MLHGLCVTTIHGLPDALAQTKTFANNSQGTLDWRMHKSCKMIVVVWSRGGGEVISWSSNICANK
jgi:hypothetical protein